MGMALPAGSDLANVIPIGIVVGSLFPTRAILCKKVSFAEYVFRKRVLSHCTTAGEVYDTRTWFAGLQIPEFTKT